jgi:hypothetical protein
MFSVMLPRNPFPGNFHQLLDVFIRSSDRIHRMIRLNLVAGANLILPGFGSGSHRLISKPSPMGFLLTGLGGF